ncbi:MAG: Crp/Fnr family transcriptional regulator [Chloroflexi bacterium]|jgi:CRP/FNR family transcriptional regulator|uniref:Crp/Fnr family transcriptional regulator n=1 Tax=Candidatus Chlorohelix allophototropha TaxID=3003348 RepID=A0A8T7LZQ1_9CHLR|nr:Crp/Fnr family transcriptional regulator [Chloroflexota bacterium]WJW65896.1 Crp/Fnr family transcriptional regulator [Chloroflexota bacterium L227-S17]
MVAEELARALAEAKPIFRKKWASLIDQRGYGFEVAKFDADVRKRHMSLWEQLIRALRTARYDEYLVILEKEGRLQARASTRIEAVVGQMSTMMNMMWDIISNTHMVEQNPGLLKPITERFNILRSRAEGAILNGFIDENRIIQDELAAESAESRRLRLERSSLQELVKSVHAFRLVRYSENQKIFQPGDNRAILYFVMMGRVRLYEILPDGRAITLSILSLNDVFAQSSNQNSYFHDVYAEAMSDSIVACIQESALDTLMEQSPTLASRIIYSFSQQLSQSQILIEGLLGRDVSLRLVNILLKLATEFGVENQNSVVIELGLTHQELADMIGSNRVTVTRKLLELQRKKLINVQNRTIQILDRRALQELVA